MRNLRIEAQIPEAINILQREVAGGGTQITDTFKGYFASFGAAVIQSGLLPAAIFFGQKDSIKAKKDSKSGPKEARWKVTWCIFVLLFPKQAAKVPAERQHAALKDYLLTRPQPLPAAEVQQILDAALALKMALRTFELVETDAKP
ncbi:MAG: hypothetical protein D6722_21355 [Bacteroidetes bacterium]|nr:MAG: hypothetical protein D6722_21355 [Bacteroidota bacterium]